MDSVIEKYFDKKCPVSTEVREDFIRKVNYDEDGNEFITYEPFDYPKFQQSLGKVTDWQLDTLLKAGINPDFPIHTGFGTRLEGFGSIEDWSAAADAVLADKEDNNK